MHAILEVVQSFIAHPRLFLRLLRRIPAAIRGIRYTETWNADVSPPTTPAGREDAPASPNPLTAYFQAHDTGRGILKWEHYFDIYHHHFNKFAGREICILEIGVYSGGSLEMWHHYFGPKCRVIGVDIEDACRAYENEYTRIFIGDQADRHFWKDLKAQVPVVDIVVDDGGHSSEQQIVSMEEMLPHLRPGGVYLCEDIFGEHAHSSYFIQSLAGSLNTLAYHHASDTSVSEATAYQARMHAIYCYPFVTVIEKTEQPRTQFRSTRRGTEWQPFL